MDPKEEIKLTQDALFVLCYFAFQTVAEIVDYALYVREDRQAGKNLFVFCANTHPPKCIDICPHNYRG